MAVALAGDNELVNRAEVIAVILFVFPRIHKKAGITLMVIFVIATTLSLATSIVINQLHLMVYFFARFLLLSTEMLWEKYIEIAASIRFAEPARTSVLKKRR